MDKSGIKYIRLCFENCEVIKIDGKHVGYFMLDDIKRSLQIFGCNAFGEAMTAQLFAVEIHKDANRPNKTFGFEAEETIFDRVLKVNDITSVEVKENNGKWNDIFVRWGGDNEYSNIYQTSMIGENGNLYIVVSAAHKAEDYFKDFKDIEIFPWSRSDWGE